MINIFKNKLTVNLEKFLLRSGGRNLRAQFLNCYKGFEYFSYT